MLEHFASDARPCNVEVVTPHVVVANNVQRVLPAAQAYAGCMSTGIDNGQCFASSGSFERLFAVKSSNANTRERQKSKSKVVWFIGSQSSDDCFLEGPF